jgi:hypothetical protein
MAHNPIINLQNALIHNDEVIKDFFSYGLIAKLNPPMSQSDLVAKTKDCHVIKMAIFVVMRAA